MEALSNYFHFAIGLDTEFVRGRAFDDELPEDSNAIVSYQASVLVPETGARFSTIAFPQGIQKRHRISLTRFISDAVTAAVAEGACGAAALDAISGGNIRIALAAHFTRADLPGFRDFNRLKKRFDGVRKTFASTSSPAVLNIRLAGGVRVRASITLVDTMLLAPAGAGSLRKLGELLGFDKLVIPPVTLPDGTQAPAIERMDLAKEQHPQEFIAYATRDAEIAVEWALRAWALAESWGIERPPQTIASMAVKTFTRLAAEDGADLHALLGTVPRDGGRGVDHHSNALLHQSFVACCFHGGRNEAYGVGQFDGEFIDWDLAGAYTSALAMFRGFDWDEIEVTTDLAVLAKLDRATFAHVEFSFPPGTRFPSLPVSAGVNGLLYPLSGNSYCTGPELVAAVNQGARIKVLHGIHIPWGGGNGPRAFVTFTRHINQERARYRAEYGKGSAMELLAKEAGNSLYGKTAQGVADMRPAGIDGLNGKSVFDTRSGTSTKIPPSGITNPAIAAMTTGLLRAALSEILANLPESVLVLSATTDGWLSTATPGQVEAATQGPVCRYFAELRAMVSPDGSSTIIEPKHDATRVISMKTRGAVTVARAPGSTSKPILARAGHRLEGEFASAEDEAAAFAELYRTRQHGTVTTRRSFVSIRTQWMTNSDLYDTSSATSVNLCYDLKRQPLDPRDEDGLIQFTTAPWQDLQTFRETRDRFDRWRKTTRSVLKTTADWQRFQAATVTGNRGGAAQRTPFQNAVVAAWAVGAMDLPIRVGKGRGFGMGLADIAGFLTLAGVPGVSVDTIKRAAAIVKREGLPPASFNTADLSPGDAKLLNAIERDFPVAAERIRREWLGKSGPPTVPQKPVSVGIAARFAARLRVGTSIYSSQPFGLVAAGASVKTLHKLLK